MNAWDNPITMGLVGVFVGLFIGMTGLGGGAVVVPILVLLFGMDQKKAQGTSLSIILSPLQIPGMVNYHRNGHIDWHFLLYMGPGVLVGTFVGSYIASAKWFPQDALKITFGLLLVYIGSYTIFAMNASAKRGLVMGLICTAVVGAMIVGSRVWDNKSKTLQPSATSDSSTRS
jgi:uncharacterized protein